MNETNLLLVDPREKRRYYFEENTFRKGVIFLLRGIFNVISQIQISGREHLPQNGPVILAANHLTNFDVFPMQLALPRPIFFMGKAELFQNPALEVVLRNLGGFPVYRGAHDLWAIRHAEKVLEHGQVLGIFPEGSRSKGKGLRPAKTGAARLATEMGCPVVPLAVTGTQFLLNQFPARTRVTITLGSPLFPEEAESALALTDRIMFSLASMLPPGLRGVYVERPEGF